MLAIFRFYILFAALQPFHLTYNNNMTIAVKISLLLLLVNAVLASKVDSDGTLALTIYDDFGMIKDVRRIQFDKGESQVAFTDVAETILTETVMFKPTDVSKNIQIY
jgi:hypothetical protein